MSTRVFVAVTLAGLFAAEASARGPFDRRRTTRRPVRSIQPPKSVMPAIFQSPEKMTEVYGPSILIRDTKPTKKPSKFVTQPK